MQGSINFDGSLVGNITGGGGGGGSEVVITPVLTSGTKIADVTVDGEEKDLFAPTPATEVSVTQVLTEGTKIASIEVDGDSTDIYAPEGGGSEVEVDPILPSGTKIATITVNEVNHDIYSPDYSGDISSLQTDLSTANSNITALQGRMTTAEGNITTLQSDMTDAESIIGDGQLDIGNDLTDAVNEINQSLSDLETLEKTVSGAIVTFDDGSDLPMPKLEVAIEPQQDLHGYDAPWAGGAGKNKFPIATASSSGTQNIFSSQSISLKANTNYILSFDTSNPITKTMSVSFNAGSTQVRGIDIPAGTSVVGISFTQNVDNLDWYVREAVNISNIMIEEGGAKTDFAPYSNICPISGWDDVNVTVCDDIDNPTVTHTYTIDLDGTRYGGTLDVVSGLLTITDGYIASYNSETLPSTWISDRDIYTEGTTPTVGAEVVYKLATSQTIQLTPTQVKSLLGVNKIFADAGNIELTFFTNNPLTQTVYDMVKILVEQST